MPSRRWSSSAYLVSVHVERVYRKVVRRQIERLEHLGEGEILAITMNDDFLQISRGLISDNCTRRSTDIGRLLQLGLDESQQVLLVHARRVVDMGIDFPDIVEVTEE